VIILERSRVSLMSACRGDRLRSILTAGCFAAYDVRSIDELSGRTTGRLGYIRQDKAQRHRRDGKAVTRYSNNIRILRRTQALLSEDCWPAGGCWSKGNAAGRRTDYGTTSRTEQQTPPPSCRCRKTFQALLGLVLAYREQRMPPSTAPCRNTFRETTDWRAVPENTAASGQLDHAKFRELADARV
jgi:hypothetical protein